MCGSLLKVQLVCFGFMATSGDVVEVYVVNLTKFLIFLDFLSTEVETSATSTLLVMLQWGILLLNCIDNTHFFVISCPLT